MTESFALLWVLDEEVEGCAATDRLRSILGVSSIPSCGGREISVTIQRKLCEKKKKEKEMREADMRIRDSQVGKDNNQENEALSMEG